MHKMPDLCVHGNTIHVHYNYVSNTYIQNAAKSNVRSMYMSAWARGKMVSHLSGGGGCWGAVVGVWA